MKSSKVVYSKSKESTSKKMETEDFTSLLPNQESSQLEYLKTKAKLISVQLKSVEADMKGLRQENDKLRQLNNDYVKQLNTMSQDKFKKIEKIVVSKEFFEQKNIDSQLKDFIRKLTNNFSFLEKEHSKLIDHTKIMENDLSYYKERVVEAEEINENVRSTGRSSINELMEELKDLKNRVDELDDGNGRLQFDMAVKENENSRLQSELEQAYEIQSQLEGTVNDLKLKHNRILSDHDEKFNKDAKFIYQLKLKSDFLEYERRLAYQDATDATKDKNMTIIKNIEMEKEIDVLRNTTDQFLKTNKHIFNLSSLPTMQFK